MDQGKSVLSQKTVFSKTEEDYQIELPPGFRFHPTDEELITHYLSKKVIDSNFNPIAIGVVDLNKCEPWDLPRKAKLGEKEWYFFCIRDRKYPTGLRTNRATDTGFWKATGKDKEIYRAKLLVGMKKTLVFYKGRAPRGEKSNWIMHEYRLEGKYSAYTLPGATKMEWVICRVIEKSLVGNGNKASESAIKIGSFSSNQQELEIERPTLQPTPTPPPLIELPAHVTCFSNNMEGQRIQDNEIFRFFNPSFQSDISSLFLSKFAANSDSFMNLLEGDQITKHDCKVEREMISISQETDLTSDVHPEISSGNEIWDYGRIHY